MRSLLVTVGTDHHRFDRIIEWVDAWFEDQPTGTVSVLVQHGFSAPSRHGNNVQFMKHDELQTAIATADIVVTHGGPASIFEARRQGHLPLCVPRDPARQEHVDGHQVRFARKVASLGLILLCEDEATFRGHVSGARARGGDRDGRPKAGPPPGLPRLQRVVQEVLRPQRR